MDECGIYGVIQAEDTLIGVVSKGGEISGRLDTQGTLVGSVGFPKCDYPLPYEGTYDVIPKAYLKLNNIEDGIEEALECCEGGGDVGITRFYVTETRDATQEEQDAWVNVGEQLPECVVYKVDVYNFTWQELKDAIIAGKIIGDYGENVLGTYYKLHGDILVFMVGEEGYKAEISSSDIFNNKVLAATSANGHLFRLYC